MKRVRQNKTIFGLGEALSRAIDALKGGGAQVPSSAGALHILGLQLMRVGTGEDARVVFGQVKIGRPSARERDWHIALAYWAARARGATEKGAVKAVRVSLPHLKLADIGIVKAAQALMTEMIGTGNTAAPDEAPNGEMGVLEFEDDFNVATLRAQVAKKAHRGKW